MYRSHTCGELRIDNLGQEVTLAGWVQKVRNLGAMTFADLRDRYGITQFVIDENSPEEVRRTAAGFGREYVLQVTGKVVERASKNPKLPTGDIEIAVTSLRVLNPSEVPPFTIEDQSDGGDELRMRYRYLDLRRNPVKEAMILRHKLAQGVRRYLDGEGFLEIETPVLIKSTPEGARDFIVPSRMNPGEFYAMPQSPQTFKQLLMVAGYDRYFQIVKCFRDEDLRADRQPEFTQIDCEMAFVEREDVIRTFEGMMRHLFAETLGVVFPDPFPRMSWHEAMERYGSDKPDIRFGMELNDITPLAQGRGFAVFDSAEYVGAICVPGGAVYTRKQIDELTEFVKRPQVGAKGLVWVRIETTGNIKSSVNKFFTPDDLTAWAERCGAQGGDMLFIISGDRAASLSALCEIRLELGERLGLRDRGVFRPLWVVDFPLLEWDEETGRYYAMHHPFTSPLPEDAHLLGTDPGKARANAYDFVVNGVEIGGGSIRIHDSALQARLFSVLGFSDEEAQAQFGFLMDAFRYGAPPHGGVAFGFDRLCSLFGGADSIRDYIAFPKNNSGRDVMIDAPSPVAQAQLDELYLASTAPGKE
ncbi:MAG: aspartate--tRNA ligase [Rikenellaceae bacterium]|nr:aspartate--tRNA ligase [Rikenellaceae bacterium]